jgi:retron-type reverse transcriptase
MEVKMNLYNNLTFPTEGNEPTMADICDSENIIFAWLKVAKNNGCAGVDGITIQQFSRNVAGNLIVLQEDLMTGAYQTSPLLRFYVDKGEKESRALSIPTVRDRVAQQAATAVLTPILDANFEECSYGYRKGKGRKQALMEIVKLRDMGYLYVLDADIEQFFDNIDHFLLIQRLADLVPEESVARLVAS